jgi:hypothetical protein
MKDGTRLVKALEAQVTESDTNSFETGEQRERNMRYYSLQPLGNERQGRSQYISPDVLDAVESKKAVFAESFLSARAAVKFVGCAYPGEGVAKTAYANDVLRRNNHDRLFRDGWHDAFVAKRMVVVADWKPDVRIEELEFEQAPLPQVQQQIQLLLQQNPLVSVDDSMISTQMVPTPQGMMPIVSGTLRLELDDSYTGLELIAPENVFRDPDAAYIDESLWVTIEDNQISRGMLKARGYDPEQVERLKADYTWRRGEEDYARKAHDQSYHAHRRMNRVDSQTQVTMYRTWTWLNPEDFAELDEDDLATVALSAELALYEIHWAHGEVLKWADGSLAIREVDEYPVFEWSEMKIAHAENGLCTADVLAHTQKATSNLKRLILDNQAIANAGVRTAVKNQILNPRDMMDNKIGSIVFTKRPDAFGVLPPPALSPLTMEVLSMMKRDSEERSGISGLAKGMNTDAVKYQNADNMIERLTTAGQRRVTMAARDFANTFLVPLCQFIVRQGMKMDRTTRVLEVAGQMMPISPQSWHDTGLEMEVAFALTPEEAQEKAQQVLMMHGMMSQDEDMKLMYGPEQKHAVFDLVFEAIGISDTTKIMLPPTSPQYQQKVQQQQMMQQQAMQAQQAAMQKQGQVADVQIRGLMSKEQREWAQFNWSRTNDMADNTREDEKLEHEKVIDFAELQLERQQKRGVDV